MADKKITDLTALTSADSTDVLEIVDVSVNTNKKVTVDGLIAAGSITNAKLSITAGEVGGASATYTPSWTTSGTSNTLGNGTLVGRYIKTGKRISYKAKVTVGSTTAGGNGNWRFSLPFAAAAHYAAGDVMGIAVMRDDSTGQPYVGYAIWIDANTVEATVVITSGSYSAVGGINSTASVPVGFAPGDSVMVTGEYEAA